MPGPSLIDHFAAWEDPRQSWKVLFPLLEILLVVLFGTLAGERTSWRSSVGPVRRGFLRRLLPYEAGVPGHDTLEDAMNTVDRIEL